MHCFVQTKSFNIGPVEDACALVRHPFRIQKILKRYITRRRRWLHFFEQLLKRKTDPGNHHRPTLNATQSIDALLERKLQQLAKAEDLGFIDKHLNRNSPGPGYKTFCRVSYSAFRRVEFIEVVVIGNRLQRSQRIRGSKPLLD